MYGNLSYDQQAISVFNRVYNAVTASSHYVGEGASSLVAALWFEAWKRTDFGADTDVVLDTYPIIDRIYAEIIVHLPSWTKVAEDPKESHVKHPLWDVYDEAMDLATEFENRIFLAALVTNSFLSLEGATDLIWQLNDNGATDRYNEEFKKDREEMSSKIRELFAAWVGFNKNDPARADVGMWLLKSDETIKAEIESEREEVLAAMSDNNNLVGSDMNLTSLHVGDKVLVGEDDEIPGVVVRKADGDGDGIIVEIKVVSDDLLYVPYFE